MKLSFRHGTPILESRTLLTFFAALSVDSKTAKLARAAAVWPVVLVRDQDVVNDILVNHECIHLRQQTEMLVVGAVIVHIIELLYIRFVKKLSGMEGYHYRFMEQEAYRNQHNLDYLKSRKFFASLRYLTDKRKLSFIEGRAPEVTLGESYK